MDGDGCFTIQNVHPGKYRLELQLDQPALPKDSPARPLAEYNGSVTVPPAGDEAAAPAVDLGDRSLTMYQPLRPGEPIPTPHAVREDGTPIDFAACRGRWLLLCLWWPRNDFKGAFAKALESAHGQYGARGDFSVLGITMDGQSYHAGRQRKKHGADWPHHVLRQEDTLALAAAFGVRDSALFVIDPGGVLARSELAPQDLLAAVGDVLAMSDAATSPP